MSRIAVIGGGLTGLSACHYVRKLIPSAQVSLFERSSNYGGWIKTIQMPMSENVKIPIELGPNSIRGGNDERSKVTSQLIADLQLTNEIIAPSDNAKIRLIYHNDTLYPLQKIATKCMLSTMIWMPWQQIYYHLKGGHHNRYSDESIADFFNRNFGENVTKILASSFVNGVYGGGIGHLSIKSCSPLNKIKEIESEYGSVFFGGLQKMMQSKTETLESKKNEILHNDDNEQSVETDVADLSEYGSFTFSNGLQQIINSLIDQLNKDEHVNLFNNFDINSMRYSLDKQCIEMNGNEQQFEFDHVINAIQPRNCSNFLSANCDLNAFNLSASLITVNVIFKNREFVEKIANKFEGFGVLIPRELNSLNTFCYDDDNSLLGIIYYSSVFPLFDEAENDNDAMSLVFMFGGPQFDIHSMTKQHIVNVCKAKIKQMYKINVDDDNEKEIVCDMETSDPLEIFSINNPDYMDADVVYYINRLNDAIDHYQVGHLEKLECLRNYLSEEYENKLSVVGSGYDGVGIPDCILSAYKCVENITNDLSVKQKAEQFHPK